MFLRVQEGVAAGGLSGWIIHSGVRSEFSVYFLKHLPDRAVRAQPPRRASRGRCPLLPRGSPRGPAQPRPGATSRPSSPGGGPARAQSRLCGPPRGGRGRGGAARFPPARWGAGEVGRAGAGARPEEDASAPRRGWESPASGAEQAGPRRGGRAAGRLASLFLREPNTFPAPPR